MKVLKKGTRQIEWKKEYTCTGKGNSGGACGAILLISQDDIYQTIDSDGYKGEIITFICPCCKTKTNITGVPANIRYALPTRQAFLRQKRAEMKKREKKERDTVILTVDIIPVIGNLEVLCIKRKKEPYTDKEVFVGGHFELTDQSTAEACVREVSEEIGLIVDINDLEVFSILDDPQRDPRHGRRISIVYIVHVSSEVIKNCKVASDAQEIVIRKINDIVEIDMGFDHWKAIKLLQKRFS